MWQCQTYTGPPGNQCAPTSSRNVRTRFAGSPSASPSSIEFVNENSSQPHAFKVLRSARSEPQWNRAAECEGQTGYRLATRPPANGLATRCVKPKLMLCEGC